MGNKKKYFVVRGKRKVIYLQERHCGVKLGDCLNTTDERIAEIRRREIHITVERGDYLNFKTLFADAVEKVRTILYLGKAPNTIGIYENALNNHILPWFGKASISSINSVDLVEYKRNRERKGTGETSIKNEIWLIRWLLKRFGINLKSPDEAYLYPHKPVDRFATEDEVLSIIAQIKRVDMRSICLVAAYSGLRQSDAMGLRWSDIDFKDGFIKLRQKKTERIVRIPLHEKLVDTLGMVPRGLGDSKLFPKIASGTLRATWVRARNEVGLDWVRFHDLRHFFASYLASTGVRREVIAEILGHKSILSTARYARFDDNTLKDAMKSFVRKPSANKKRGLETP